MDGADYREAEPRLTSGDKVVVPKNLHENNGVGRLFRGQLKSRHARPKTIS